MLFDPFNLAEQKMPVPNCKEISFLLTADNKYLYTINDYNTNHILYIFDTVYISNS